MKLQKLLKIFLLTFGMIIGLSGCVEKEISDIWSELNDQNNRITAIENLNKDVTRLQELVKIIEEKDFITGVTDNPDGSYTITFKLSDPIVIKNGKDGEYSGIGVEADNSGKLFWKVDGEWLLGENGDKIPASAVAPKVRINPTDGMWEISADDGETWTSTGVKAGSSSESSLFSKKPELTNGGKAYTFYLTDGTSFSVPAYQETCLIFSVGGVTLSDLNEKVKLSTANPTLDYAIQSSGKSLEVWAAVLDDSSCEAAVNETSETDGNISFTGLTGGKTVSLNIKVLQNGEKMIEYILSVTSTDKQTTPLPAITNVTAAAGSDKISVTVTFLKESSLATLECHLYLDGVDKAPYTKTVSSAELSSGTCSFDLGSGLAEGTYSLEIIPANSESGKGTAHTVSVVIEAAPPVVEDNTVPALPSAFSTSSSEKLAPGVFHYVASHSGISMDILKVDLTEPTVKIDLGTGKIPGGTKTVLQHCKDNSVAGHRVVGAVNNDFFVTDPDGVRGLINFSPCIKDGMFLSPSWGGYATLAFNKTNEPLIYNLKKNWLGIYPYAYLKAANGTGFDIKQYNVKNPDWTDQLSIIYNKFFNGTPPSHSGTLYVTIKLGNDIKVHGNVFGNVLSTQWNTAPAVTEDNQIVVALTDYGSYKWGTDAEKAFTKGSQITLTQFMAGTDSDQPHKEVITAWGGIPRIVTGGAVDNTSIDSCGEPSPEKKRPRTAIGYSSDKQYLYLVATEGESTTLKEEANIMVALGCAEAINCDGGGSTQMVTSKDGINFTNVSSASNNGGSYRAVINAALIVSTAL